MVIVPKCLKITNFKFDKHAPWESSDMTPEKGHGQCHGNSVIFEGLNGNSSKMAKDTEFTFGTYAHRYSPNGMPEKLFSKGGGRGHRHVIPQIACR